MVQCLAKLVHWRLRKIVHDVVHELEHLGWALAVDGQAAEATQALGDALDRLGPSKTDTKYAGLALYALGRAHMRTGQFAAAEEVLRSAIETARALDYEELEADASGRLAVEARPPRARVSSSNSFRSSSGTRPSSGRIPIPSWEAIKLK